MDNGTKNSTPYEQQSRRGRTTMSLDVFFKQEEEKKRMTMRKKTIEVKSNMNTQTDEENNVQVPARRLSRPKSSRNLMVADNHNQSRRSKLKSQSSNRNLLLQSNIQKTLGNKENVVGKARDKKDAESATERNESCYSKLDDLERRSKTLSARKAVFASLLDDADAFASPLSKSEDKVCIVDNNGIPLIQTCRIRSAMAA